jgi:thiamine-monophosphate kinase
MAENEQQLIGRLFAPLSAGLEGAYGLGDDAAALAPPQGSEFVVTLDTLIEGVHFLFDGSPRSAANAAHKALAVNVSDLAAKGAIPYAYLLSLALPVGYEAWIVGFAEGLKSSQGKWALKLAGGDTVRSDGAFAVSITAMGCVPQGRMIRRSTAGAGDVLMVSGTIGDAYAGLQLSLQNPVSAGWPPLIGKTGTAHFLARTRTPTPQVRLVPALRRYATAALDISDGLALDAARLGAASNLAVEIDAAHVPLSDPARLLIDREQLSFAELVTGGDDYEVLAAIRPNDEAAYQEAAAEADVSVTRIGRLEKGKGLVIRDAAGLPQEFERLGWDHLA